MQCQPLLSQILQITLNKGHTKSTSLSAEIIFDLAENVILNSEKILSLLSAIFCLKDKKNNESIVKVSFSKSKGGNSQFEQLESKFKENNNYSKDQFKIITDSYHKILTDEKNIQKTEYEKLVNSFDSIKSYALYDRNKLDDAFGDLAIGLHRLLPQSLKSQYVPYINISLRQILF